MCGIIGYTGSLQAKDVLIRGLKRMEYRGYDSAGIAVQTPLGLNVKHKVGKVAGLEAMVESMDIDGTCGIGHTRWATHGKPSENNAHPHTACANDIAVVHNGIIENYATLKEELIGRGHVFSSETDTEVIAHLVEEAYDGDLLDAVRQATYRLAGAYGIAVVCDAEPGRHRVRPQRFAHRGGPGQKRRARRERYRGAHRRDTRCGRARRRHLREAHVYGR